MAQATAMQSSRGSAGMTEVSYYSGISRLESGVWILNNQLLCT